MRVYEISEAELERLASGPAGQVHLSFALALLPAALTIFITLQTVEIQNLRIYVGYWIAFWLLFVQGVASLVRWWVSGRSNQPLIEVIRERMPQPPGAPAPDVAPSSDSQPKGP